MKIAYHLTPKYRAWKKAYDRQRYLADPSRYANSAWRSKNREKMAAYQRDWTLRKNYGITLVDHDRLLVAQERRCAVCQTEHTKGKPLHVDHCHQTGRVRGLLCFKCNVVLGHVGDSPQLLRRLRLYLKGAPCE